MDSDYLPAVTGSSTLPAQSSSSSSLTAYDYDQSPVRVTAHPLPRATNPAYRHLRSQESRVSVASKRSQLNKLALAIGAPEPPKIPVDGDRRKVHPSQTFPYDYVHWEDLTADKVAELLALLRDQGLSPATRNAYRSLLRGVAREARLLKKMSHEDAILIGEIKGARFTRLPGGKAHPEEVIAALLATCDAVDNALGCRDGVMITLLVTTGVRRAELVSINLDDIDFETRTLVVVGKGNKDRKLKIPDATWERIVDYLDRYRGYEPGPLFTAIWNNGKKAINNKAGLSTTSINRRLMSIRQRTKAIAGTDIAPHDFRRTFATDLYNRGMSIRAIQVLLGHASLATTEAYLFDDGVEYREEAAIINADRFRKQEPFHSKVEANR